MTARRLSQGGLIDRSKPLAFQFDGKPYSGFDGDTVASALLAQGVRIFGRSFKYHRPRGIWGAWFDDPNAIMNIAVNGTEHPNCTATTTYLAEGMTARAVNAWPSAAHDVKGGLDLFHRWLGAGFYYKTFMWPDWHLFEPAIRKMAGLGTVSDTVDPRFVADQIHDHCDLLIVGAGAAGLSAARAAAEQGQNVCLVDDQSRCGGGIYQYPDVDGRPPDVWVSQQITAIEQAGGRVLPQTTAFGVYDHGLIGLAQAGDFGTAPTLIRMRAGQVLLTTGALDRPITFQQNDRPGIMSLSGAAEYLARYGVLVGRRLAVIATHSMADLATSALENAGAEITRIDLQAGPISGFSGRQVTGIAQQGKKRVFDAVLTSGGLTPVLHLWRHANGKLRWCDARQAFLPGDPPTNMQVAGAANGTFDLTQAIEEGAARAANTAWAVGETRYHLTPHWPDPGSKGRQWIDFQHDVTLKDIETAARENFTSVEHLKRYTTLGMASDQGKTSNMAGLAAMATLQGKAIPAVGTTTFRPPFVPVPLEMYRGSHREQMWHPLKRLPLEPVHRALGAALGEYGGWLRPGWYGAGPAQDRVTAEVQAARATGGVFDGSTLGKIEVMGPDAEAFLNFIYYNTMRTLKPGHIRYGFMLTEGGIVFDDGVVLRLSETHFVVSCSSSHVDAVRTHLEAWRQDGNDPDRIFIHDATQHWATVSVTGPRARDVVAGLALDVDLSRDAFAHMTFRKTTWRDTALRIARVSFSGDLSYEISVRAGQAQALWQALSKAGAAHDVGPIGLESMSVMRAEKGYIIIGKDTDGETMPHDLGFDRPRQAKKTAYLGDRSLQTETAHAAGRKALVGLASSGDMLPTGAHVVQEKASQGYVTSSYFSPTLNKPIALALVADGHQRIGETVTVWHLGKTISATICAPCFFDPEGERLHA